jgi:hypothetical protein
MAMRRPLSSRPASGGNTPRANAAASAQFPSLGKYCGRGRRDVAITGISIRACIDAVPGEGKSRSGVARDQFFCQL